MNDSFNKTITLKAGTSQSVEIPFICHPAPTASLSFKDGEVRDTARQLVVLDKENTKVSFKNCERRDTGSYSLELKNDFGKASVDIELIVLGKKCSR